MFLLVLVGGVLFLKSDYAARMVCDAVGEGLEEALGLKTSIGACSIGLLPPALDANEVEVRTADGSRLVEMDELRVELDSLALLAGRFAVDGVRMVRPVLHLAMQDGRLRGIPEVETSPGEGGDDGSSLLPARVEVEDGRFNLVLEGSALIRLEHVGIRVAGRGRGELDLVAEVGGGGIDMVGAPGASIALESCKIKAGLETDRLRLDHLAVQLEDTSVDANGHVALEPERGSSRVDLRATGPLRWLHLLLPEVPVMDGIAVVRADASLEGGVPRVQGAVDVKEFGLDAVCGVDFKTRFELDGDRLVLEGLAAGSPAGHVTGRAELGLEAPWAFEGALDLDGVRLDRALRMGGLRGSPVTLQGKGQVDFAGQFGGTGPEVRLSLHLDLARLAVPSWVALSGARLALDAHIDGQRARVPSLRLRRGEARIDAEGKVDFFGGAVQLAARAAEIELGDFSPLAGVPVAGRCSFELALGGRLPAYELAIELEGDGLIAEERHIGSIRTELLLRPERLQVLRMLVARRGGVARLAGQLDLAPPHRLQGRGILDEAPLAEVLPIIQGGSTPSFLEGKLVGELQAGGTLDSPELDFRMAFHDARLGPQLFEEGGVAGRLRGGVWHLDLLEARMGPGWLFARGKVTEDAGLDITAYSTGLRVASFTPLAGMTDELDFRLDLHLAIKGPLRAPSLTGWTKVYDTRLQGKALADSYLSAAATTESFRITGRFMGKAASLAVHARLEEGLPFSARLGFASSRLGELLAPAIGDLGLRVALQGQVEARGRLLAPGSIQGRLRLERLSVTVGSLSLCNRGDVLLGLDGGDFTIESFELAGTDTALVLRGGGGLQSGPALEAEGTLALGMLPPFVGFLRRAAGRSRLRLTLRGDWHAPAIAGSAEIEADALRFSGFSQELQAVSGTVDFTPRRAQITKLRGKLGGGTFSGQGQLQLEAFVPSAFSLNFDLERVRYMIQDGLWGVGTGALSIRGAPGRPVELAGEVRIHEGGYEEHIRLVSLSEGLFRKKVDRARTYDLEREVLAFDIRLQIPERFQVRYNLDLIDFKAEMRGALRVTGTNERLGLLGEMEAIDGTVTYISKNFELRSARVAFVEEFSVHPRVDVLATLRETVDRGEERGGKTEYVIDLRVRADGDARPEIKLTSDPHEDERDIITLLHFGFTSRDVETLKGEDLVGLGGEILFRSFKLDERLGKLFPFPPEVIQPKYLRVRSRFSPGSGGQRGMVSPRLEVGAKLRLISENLDVDYSRSLYDDTDQSLDLTYELSETVSTRVRWEDAGQQASPGDIGDLGLDLRLHWDW